MTADFKVIGTGYHARLVPLTDEAREEVERARELFGEDAIEGGGLFVENRSLIGCLLLMLDEGWRFQGIGFSDLV